MALALKKKQFEKLGADIERLRADLLAFLEERVAAAKRTQDGAGIPIEVLRHDILAGDPCWRRAVTRPLDESQ
jgi:hypothetical protein